MRSHRAHLLALGVLAAVLLTAGVGVALFALPLVAILGLLAGGRFVGEERILARYGAAVPQPRRASSRRWQPVRPSTVRSALDRAPRTFRGPPAAVFATA